MPDSLLFQTTNLSPYDEAFPAALLQEAFDYQVQQSQEMTQKQSLSAGSPLLSLRKLRF